MCANFFKRMCRTLFNWEWKGNFNIVNVTFVKGSVSAAVSFQDSKGTPVGELLISLYVLDF